MDSAVVQKMSPHVSWKVNCEGASNTVKARTPEGLVKAEKWNSRVMQHQSMFCVDSVRAASRKQVMEIRQHMISCDFEAIILVETVYTKNIVLKDISSRSQRMIRVARRNHSWQSAHFNIPKMNEDYKIKIYWVHRFVLLAKLLVLTR